MEIAAVVLASVFAALSLAGMLWLFVWAARKDGAEDRALQSRLGIRRKTRLGR